MNPSHAPLRGSIVVITAVVMLGAPAHSAPKKAEPQPASQKAAVPVEGVTEKTKSSKTSSGSKKAPAATSGTAAKRAPGAQATVKAKPAPAAVPDAPPTEEAAPKKRGFIRKLFGAKSQPEPEARPDAEPKLAKVKTVKPAPVKEVKPAKPDEKLAKIEEEEVPKKKGGLFGFLRRDRTGSAQNENKDPLVPAEAKMERPDDWQDRSVVKEDEIALYEYGPSQSQGPDARLGRGTLVKVQSIKRGWAHVQVEGGRSGYMDAAALRSAEKDDFKDPVIVIPAMASVNPAYWAPAAPPPDLPDQPGPTANDAALLLLPPLELEPKKP